MRAKGFKMILLGIAIVALFGALVLLLWNLIVPAVFDLPAINFWQASGLFILGRIFFGGFGGARMMMAGRMHGHHPNPMHDKWMKMTPDQRREFIKRRREFGGGPFGRRDFCSRDNSGKNENTDTGNPNE